MYKSRFCWVSSQIISPFMGRPTNSKYFDNMEKVDELLNLYEEQAFVVAIMKNTNLKRIEY